MVCCLQTYIFNWYIFNLIFIYLYDVNMCIKSKNWLAAYKLDKIERVSEFGQQKNIYI